MGVQSLGLLILAVVSCPLEARWAIAALGVAIWLWSLVKYGGGKGADQTSKEVSASTTVPINPEANNKPSVKDENQSTSTETAAPQMSARAARHAARLAATGGNPASSASGTQSAGVQQQQAQTGSSSSPSSSNTASASGNQSSSAQTASFQAQTMAQAEAALNAISIDDAPEEIAKLAADVRSYALKLNRTITNLEGSLRRMMPSINGANRGMQEIKSELSRTMASVIQVTQSSEMHAKKAKDVFVAAEQAAAGSQVGAQSTEQTIRNMERIREQMELIAERMENLLKKSQLMVQVVGFSDELALQSKVLSVNAAIEAAKAGDRGEGFSAVAREVKSLANQSKEATRQVRQILKEIQKSIADVRSSVSVGNQTVDLASDQCRSTVDSIRGLDNSVSSSRDAAEAIVNSSKEQVQGIMLISHAMNDIQTVSEQNSGSLGNLQVEAQKLSSMAKEVLSEMSSYQKVLEELMEKISKK